MQMELATLVSGIKINSMGMELNPGPMVLNMMAII